MGWVWEWPGATPPQRATLATLLLPGHWQPSAHIQFKLSWLPLEAPSRDGAGLQTAHHYVISQSGERKRL